MEQPKDPTHEVIDPATDAARLAALAAERPDLGAAIARHPNTYDGLLDWLSSYGSAEAQQAVADRRSGVNQTPGSLPRLPPPAFEPSPPNKGFKATKGVIAAGIAIGVLGVGGAVWATVDNMFGGASSPEKAAESVFEGLTEMNILTLATSIAPSEVNMWKPTIETASDLSFGDVETDSISDLLKNLKNAVSITAENLEYETKEITDDVAIVRLVSGTITIDGDPEEIADTLINLSRPTMEFEYLSYGYSGDDLQREIEYSLESAKEYLVRDLELPFELDIDEYLHDRWSSGYGSGESDLAVVTVNEGGWYVSPMMTYAEQRLYSLAWGDPPRHGNKVVEAIDSDSPEDALEEVQRALSRFSTTYSMDSLAATMSLPERRLLSIYGDAFLYYGGFGAVPSFQFEVADFNIEQRGKNAHAEIEELRILSENTDYGDVYELRAFGTCFEVIDHYSSYAGTRGCLRDIPLLKNLGIDDSRIALVKEDGSWLISPMTTLANIGAVMVEGISEYAQDGNLEALYR